jgi:hypothetical protein
MQSKHESWKLSGSIFDEALINDRKCPIYKKFKQRKGRQTFVKIESLAALVYNASVSGSVDWKGELLRNCLLVRDDTVAGHRNPGVVAVGAFADLFHESVLYFEPRATPYCD